VDAPPITSRTVWKEAHLFLPTPEANWRAVLLYSADWLRLNRVEVGSHLVADLTRVQGRAEVVALFDTAAKSDTEGRMLSVGRFPAGRPLPAPKPAFPVKRRADEPHPDTHRAVWLFLDKGGGDWVKVGLLRSLDWIRANGVRVGGIVRLELEEMSAVGDAVVERIDPCPEIEPGRPGRGLVTGVFEHSRGQVGELRVEGEPTPIGVTPGHLFWSEDRQDFVPVDQLLPGERLLVRNGTTRVIDYTLTDRVEPVYNLEVESDHVYRVGEQGILVHNTSQVCNPAAGSVSYGPSKMVTFTDKTGKMVTGEVGTGVIAYLTPANVGNPRIDLDEPKWWDDLQGVAGGTIQLGHILASSIGGSGKKSWNNLTPLYRNANTPAMRTCEGFLKKLVTECHYCVTVDITVEGYGHNMSVPAEARPAMPTRVRIEWVDDCGMKGTFIIDNYMNAAVQDPCRVKNLPCRP
jgi:hypothetical protein